MPFVGENSRESNGCDSIRNGLPEGRNGNGIADVARQVRHTRAADMHLALRAFASII